MRRIDTHHIIHNRVDWTSRPESKALRSVPSLMPRMERGAHNELHKECPPVPLLGYYALTRALRTFEPVSDTMESMEGLMASIEEASRHPRAHPVEKSLAELAVWAIDLQRPFIAGELSNVRRTFIDLGE